MSTNRTTFLSCKRSLSYGHHNLNLTACKEKKSVAKGRVTNDRICETLLMPEINFSICFRDGLTPIHARKAYLTHRLYDCEGFVRNFAFLKGEQEI